ncbi:MAG: HNH endonuclease [Candidatus Kapaibacterium sp.]
MINEAIKFVLDSVDRPAIQHPSLDKNFKKKVISSQTFVKNYKKVGDLYLYLCKFKKDQGIYHELKKLNLNTYEDIIETFKSKFKYYLNDCTTIKDFVIGKKYSAFDIALFSFNFNLRASTYPVGDEPNYQSIFITVNLKGGKYPNTYYEDNGILKYYLYNRKSNYDVNYKCSRAILNSNKYNTPIYAFIKLEKNVYELKGIFKYHSLHTEQDASKWVQLIRNISKPQIDEILMTETAYRSELDYEVNKSLGLSEEERNIRLEKANKKPEKQKIITTYYKRNADVISTVLIRAKGICERCNSPAPFYRNSNNTPYLEVHHIIMLSKRGEDTVENSIAICPNCHRELHFGIRE